MPNGRKPIADASRGASPRCSNHASGRSPGSEVLVCRLPARALFCRDSQWRVAHPHFLTVAGAAEALAERPHLFPVSPRPLNATGAPDAGRILRDIRFLCLRARGRGNQHFCKPERKSYPSLPTRGALVKTHAGVFSFAMTRCAGHFAAMTPEEIGKNGEPFFPKEMLSAMVVAGREVICPVPRKG